MTAPAGLSAQPTPSGPGLGAHGLRSQDLHANTQLSRSFGGRGGLQRLRRVCAAVCKRGRSTTAVVGWKMSCSGKTCYLWTESKVDPGSSKVLIEKI